MKANTHSLVVPAAVIRRLPMYYRYMQRLQSKEVERISSGELSKMMGITSSQLRQDLSHFGEFGQQGYGYQVNSLYRGICEIMGIEREYRTVLVGTGNLGRALINYENFRRRGLLLLGFFDNNPSVVGENIRGIQVQGTEKLLPFLKDEKIEIGIITTPATEAQEIADIMVSGGVKGIWNFAPYPIKVVSQVTVENTHIGDGLLSLFFNMKQETKLSNSKSNLL